MKIDKIWQKDGYVLRPAQEEDAERYFQQNFNPLDKEAVRLTGCRETFTREEIADFFRRSIHDADRCLFLLLSPDGRMIGESVINEIDWDLRRANFRIGIFQSTERGKGIGTWATEMTRDFAFEDLKLHRLELDVFSFNPRAERAYLKAGFKREGVLRDAVMDGDQYAGDILMALLEDEWRKIKM